MCRKVIGWMCSLPSNKNLYTLNKENVNFSRRQSIIIIIINACQQQVFL